MREFVRGKGKYVRFRSVENVIKEVLELKESYRIRNIEFVDEIFGMKIDWLREFSRLWKDEVKLPFQCNLRTDLVNEEVVYLLKSAGCIAVAFGIESGSERIRNLLFDKELSEESIINAAELLHRKGIKIITYNILGAPGETMEDTWKTMHINQRIKTDYASVSLMQPYPGTKIYDKAISIHCWYNVKNVDEFPFSFHDTLPVENKDKIKLINLQKLFNISVWFPWTEPLVRFLIKLPVNPLYYLLFLITHTSGFWIRIKKISFGFILNLLVNVRKIYSLQKSLHDQKVGSH